MPLNVSLFCVTHWSAAIVHHGPSLINRCIDKVESFVAFILHLLGHCLIVTLSLGFLVAEIKAGKLQDNVSLLPMRWLLGES